MVSGDFDGNDHQDYALLVRMGSDRSWIAVAYGYGDHWRGGNVDVWTPAVKVKSIEVLPPGTYEGTLRGRAAGHEKRELGSPVPGLLVVLGNGERRAYFLGAHAWDYVTLGEPGQGSP